MIKIMLGMHKIRILATAAALLTVCSLLLLAAMTTAIYPAAAAAAAATTARGPGVMITGYTVEPAVFMPGDTGTITLTIKNMDPQALVTETVIETPSGFRQTTDKTVRSISAEIETIRLSGIRGVVEWLEKGTRLDRHINIGALGPGESIQVSLPVKVAAHARDGTYFPEIVIDVDNGVDVRFPIRVDVESSEVILHEEDIPAEIPRFGSREIAIVIANNRPNSVSGVNVFVESKTGELEFEPVARFIGKLEPFEKKIVNFTVIPISEGTHEISFKVEYRNALNLHHSWLVSSVVVKEGSRSRSSVRLILVDAPDYVLSGDVARIDFDVANGLVRDIRAVTIVPEKEGVKILPSEYFIGDMEAGDLFSASFNLHTHDLIVGEIAIPFRLIFKDAETERRFELPDHIVHVEIREPAENALPVLVPVIIVLLFIVTLIAAAVLRGKMKRKPGR
ncbi:MAG: hypothetical protein H0M93_03580 [Methanophagales archaeon]|nr:hypothetical protein [Methanophagales archaeon]